MQGNPFQPPQASLVEHSAKPGSPVKAVLLGLAIDVGGSVLLGVVLAMAYAFSLAAKGLSENEIKQAMETLSNDSWMSIVGLLAGSGLSVLAGYVCARVSGRQDYKLGFVLGALSATSGMLLSFGAYSFMTGAALSGLTVLAVLLGTRLGRAQRVTA